MNELILVVDDDEIVRSGLQANLEQQGFRVTPAANGEEALQCIEQDKPALALCDLVLGDINGIELMKKMHAMRPEMAVIIITGHGTIKNALEALRNGAADYIQKPATPEEVIHRIRGVLHSIHLRRTLESERATMELKKRETSQQRMRHDRMTAVGIMAEGAARALNEILRPILNYAPAIRDALPRDNPARELIAEIEAAGMKAGELLGDLHYIGAGTGITKATLDVATLINSVATGPAATALRDTRPNVKLQLQQLHSTSPIEANAPMLERALNNLISFAAEPLTQADAVISISVTSAVVDKPSPAYGPAKPGTYIALVISDNGTGLPVEDLDRLFEPFYTMRLGRTISGLALPLVYRVIADHGGSLDVTSAPGRGTSFTIHLPAAGVADQTETIELRPDYSGGETILVLDDNPAHRDLATSILASQGYQVIAVDNTQSALAKITEATDASAPNIDLAVIDFVLGSPLDGLDAFRQITKVQPRQKAIIASGFADLARLTEAKRSGISKVIPKPYTHDSLTRAVREALDE